MAELLFNDYDSMTYGEHETALVLEKGLPSPWVVVCNKLLPDRFSSPEIDFIIIGDRRVYAIDEKSWGGRITGTDREWVRSDGFPSDSPLNKIEQNAKALATYIRNKTAPVGIPGTFVLGCVSLSKADRLPLVSDDRIKERVFLISDMCERILQLDNRGGNAVVGSRRNAIKDSIHDLSARPKVPKRLLDWHVDDWASVRPGAILCDVTHINGDKRLLTLYKVSPHDQETKEFFLQEFQAYRELAGSGVCPTVQDYLSWGDDHMVVVSHKPEGVALRIIGPKRPPGSEEELVNELEMAAAIYRSISVVHSRGIVHRALTPSNIYLSPEGQSWNANLIGFYACRRPYRSGGSIAPTLNEYGIGDDFTAPELKIGYEYAEKSSDTFSISLILLSRLTGRTGKDLKSDLTRPILGPDSQLQEWIELPLLEKFFTDTLGPELPLEEPISGTGRLSAEQCYDRLKELLQLLR